jgi:hypothetical protein
LVNSSDDDQRHIDAIEEPGIREPKPTDWGFCAYGDAPPAIGGGMPWFYWFENEQAMLAALREHAAYLNPPPSDRSAEDLQSAVADILSSDVRFPDDAVRARLNEALQNASQFEWLGSFEQLTKGGGEFEKKIRHEFREDDDKPTDKAIAAADLGSFAEFTRSYGV